MTKREIVLKVSDETGIKQIDVLIVVQKTLESIIDSLSKGEKVELRNFGIFKVKSRRAKKGRNPRTGETVAVPERKVVTFKSGMVMKSKVGTKK